MRIETDLGRREDPLERVDGIDHVVDGDLVERAGKDISAPQAPPSFHEAGIA